MSKIEIERYLGIIFKIPRSEEEEGIETLKVEIPAVPEVCAGQSMPLTLPLPFLERELHMWTLILLCQQQLQGCPGAFQVCWEGGEVSALSLNWVLDVSCFLFHGLGPVLGSWSCSGVLVFYLKHSMLKAFQA